MTDERVGAKNQITALQNYILIACCVCVCAVWVPCNAAVFEGGESPV